MADEIRPAKNDAAKLLAIIALIAAVAALFLASQAYRKASNHYHSSTSSGAEVENTGGERNELMRGTGQPPTQ